MTAGAQPKDDRLAHRTLQEIDSKTGNPIGAPAAIEAFVDAKVLVILGDPGAGKTTLLQSLAKAGRGFVTARRASNTAGGITSAHPLIDGLDEVTGEITDAMEVITSRLSAASSPPVVISCRIQDWRSGTAL